MFIDLDHFKRINDSIGHGRGDRLLVEIAKRLTVELREDDAINYLSRQTTAADGFRRPGHQPRDRPARGRRVHGGAVGCGRYGPRGERGQQRILESLSQPIPLQSHNPVVTPSIGIAIYPQDGTDPDSLVRNADTAMYVAKAEGRACFRFYDEEMNAKAVEQLKMEEELREAMQRNELELRYQPQVETTTGTIVSMEALVRWKHPVRGMVSAGRSSSRWPSAPGIDHRTGRMGDVRGGPQLPLLGPAGAHPPFRVSVNISPLQFNQNNMAQQVADFLSTAPGLPPERLELELTESAIMTDAETNIAKLRELKGHRTGPGRG